MLNFESFFPSLVCDVTCSIRMQTKNRLWWVAALTKLWYTLSRKMKFFTRYVCFLFSRASTKYHADCIWLFLQPHRSSARGPSLSLCALSSLLLMRQVLILSTSDDFFQWFAWTNLILPPSGKESRTLLLTFIYKIDGLHWHIYI